MPPKRVLKTLPISEKFKAIQEVESGVKKKDVAIKYGIPQNTLSTILKNKRTIIQATESRECMSSKRLKKPIYENVDSSIIEWFRTARAQNLPVSGRIIKQKATEFATVLGENNFKASTGWLDKWKRR